MNNPSCPHCGGDTHKIGFSKSGFRRYRCKACKKTHTGNPLGRIPEGEKATKGG